MTDRTFRYEQHGGPMLVYISSDRETVTLVDRSAPSDARERVMCEALLIHALALIDAREQQ